ncbi:hypothetical protein PV327_008978 [Microctonus hyperodae]|uniref:Uncharacterized protein n=1 Tax=Microctonus hyperodae TaxID=165561 RepID=A0AA39KVK5_MICHY|nr:hypothetical protein PV327_008978 [Microctonus hyperodae]
MTSVGRGRGWGKNLQDNSDGLRKPGQQSSLVVIENDDWFERISKIDINDVESIKNLTSPVANLIPQDASKEDITHLNKFCELALDDRAFALKLILTFANSTNYLPLFMTCLQKLYNQREELSKKNPVRFINMVFFLGETFHRLRFDNTSLDCLKTPLVVCLRMLLGTAGEDEIQLAATQVAIHGRELLAASITGLPELFIYAREVLATRNLSTRSRSMLLLMIDLYRQNFMPLSGDLQTFYVSQLGQSTLLEMQRNSENILVITNSELQDNPTEKCNVEPGILMQVPEKSHKKNTPKNFTSRGDAGRPMSSVPRAIRGSGAGEIPENFKVRNFDTRAHRNDGNKGYGHDDRFSKDY